MEVMVDAVSNANISLTADDVDKFLVTSGYTGRSEKKKASEIVNLVQSILQRQS